MAEKSSNPTRAEYVAETLRNVLGLVNTMLATTPDKTTRYPAAVIHAFAREHERVVQAVADVIVREIEVGLTAMGIADPGAPGLHVKIEDHFLCPQHNRNIVCEWRGETPKHRNIETSQPLISARRERRDGGIKGSRDQGSEGLN